MKMQQESLLLQEDWFEFDWMRDGLHCHTIVDQKWKSFPDKQRNFPAALQIKWLPKGKTETDKTTPFYRMRMRTFQKKVGKLAKKYHMTLVGSLQYGCTIEKVYYGHYQENAFDFLGAIKNRFTDATTHVSLDPDWQVYYSRVYPNMAQYQSVENKKISAQLAKAGDDIHTARRVSHYITFPTEIARLEFEAVAREQGYALGNSFYASERPLAHGSCVCNMMKIDVSSLNQCTNHLIYFIERFGGHYEYWSCAPIREAKKIQ